MTTQPPFFVITRILHLALLTGLILFAGIVMVLTWGNWVVLAEEGRIFLLVASGLVATSIGMSFILQNVLAAKVSRAPDVYQAQAAYQVMCLVRWALAEGPGLCCLVFFLIHRDVVFLVLALLCIAFLVCRGPSKAEMSSLVTFSDDVQEL